MALTTTTQRFRIVNTNTAGLAGSSTLDTSALIVNNDGGIYLSRKGNTALQVAAAPDHIHNNYLPLNGSQSMTGALTISATSDAKIILNNTDSETKYQYISFKDNGTEYGTLGTFGDNILKWRGTAISLEGHTHDNYISSQTWRPIKINNAQKIAASSSSALDIYAGSNITLSWNSSNNRVTINANVPDSETYTHPASTSGTTAVNSSLSSSTATTLAHADTFTVVTGAYRDASGHISKVATTNFKLPSIYSHPASTSGTTTVNSSLSSSYATSLDHEETFTVVTGARRDSSGHISKVVTTKFTLPSASTYSHPALGTGTTTVDTSAVTAASLGHGDTFTVVTGARRDASGHITKVTTQQLTLPSGNTTDTKNTAGSTNSTSKLFLIGATSQGANPQTYSNSSVYATNGSVYGYNFITSSDKRLKTDITKISVEKLSNSLNLNFVEFDYKDTNNHSAGHIAQDVKEILPEFVYGNESENEYLSINYTGLHSIQIAALLDRIEKLEEEIKQLKSSSR